MAQVFKVKYGDTLRRVCAPLYKDRDAEGFSYLELELKVRDLFGVPSTSGVMLTYMDTEDDVVTLADDQDLRDACFTQQLNPLKLELKVVPTQPLQAIGEATSKMAMTVTPHTTEFNVEGLLKGLFPESTAKAIEQVLKRYPPCLFTTVPAHVLPEALDTFLRTLTAHGENTELGVPPLQRGDQAKVEVVPDRLVHKRIECDHCYMFPIVGPRYKSIKKDDYDLCADCFNKVGNATDYVRMAPPSVSKMCRKTPLVKAVDIQYTASVAPRAVFSRGSYGWVSIQKPSLAKSPVVEDDRSLDAQFLCDVTVPDGTKVEVGTSFTKVWRLKNSGMLPWPQHTQLVRLHGDLFGPSSAVMLKLPEGGLPCGSEYAVIVHLQAPENTGFYSVDWRLIAPSGKMFGHSVWVVIEAVPKMVLACEAKESLIDEATLGDADDLAPKKMIGSVEEGTMLAKESAVDESALEDADNSLLKSTSESVEECTALSASGLMSECMKIESNSFSKVALVDPPLLSDSDEKHGESDGFSLVENELVKECVNDENLSSAEEFELVDPLPDELASTEDNSKQHDVNVEPLQNSDSEDDSSAITGWDHMLKELKEMGFHDLRTNKNLLLKNEGSIKRAVKELVELEKQMSHKIKAA